MSEFIAGHEIAIQDTGAPRGERNYWRVLLNGQSIYEGHNGAQARRTYRAVSEGLKRATQPAAGEHVCTLKGRIPHYAIKGSNFLPCYCWSGVDHQIGREVNAPPAAAHGDEAKLREALRRLLDLHCPLTGNPSDGRMEEFWRYEKSQGRGDAEFYLFALAAMRAQGDGDGS